MAIVVDWKIKSRSGVCSHTERAFEDEEPFYTCIFDDPESDGFIRRDFSVDSWNELSDTLEPRPFSFWKSVYKEKKEVKKEEAMKQNSVEAMLHRMIEEDEPATENARFILALMLERKKILIPTEVNRTETRTLLFYEHRDTGSVYIVTDPELKLDEIGKIQEEVSELLAAEEARATGESSEEASQEEDGSEVEVADENGDSDGAGTEEGRDEAPESEEKAIAGSCEESPQ